VTDGNVSALHPTMVPLGKGESGIANGEGSNGNQLAVEFTQCPDLEHKEAIAEVGCSRGAEVETEGSVGVTDGKGDKQQEEGEIIDELGIKGTRCDAKEKS